jgi:hypothetical protein
LEAIALALSTPAIGKKKFLAVQALASGLRRLHRFQNKKEPVSETGAKERKKIQPQEESDRRRRKKNFQRIGRRKSTGRRSHSKPPGLHPFDFARGKPRIPNQSWPFRDVFYPLSFGSRPVHQIGERQVPAMKT